MILTTALFVLCHSFHLSVTDIFINEHDKAEIVFTLFVDDLENAVNATKEFGQIDLLNEATYDMQKSILQAYLPNRFDLTTDNGKVSLQYLGHEIKENRCFIYLESKVPVTKALSFSNRLLMDVFSDQKNLIQFEHGGQKETALFDDDEDVFITNLK